MDPATLSDEELDAALATNPPEPSDPPEPDAPEPPEPATPTNEDPEAPEDPPTPPSPDGEDEDVKPPSRRETLRIQQVLERAKQNQPTETPTSPREDALDYATELDADPEIIKRLQDDRTRAEDARYQEGLRQASAMEWRTMVRVDTPSVEAKYPFLDKESPDYHPAITDAMYNGYLGFVGYNPQTGMVDRPNVRFSDYVDAQYELADEMASLKTKDTAKHIARQASQAGLRPDGSAPKRLNLNQDPSAMSDDELDAVIAQAIPKR